jgi:hypothetical protein
MDPLLAQPGFVLLTRAQTLAMQVMPRPRPKESKNDIVFQPSPTHPAQNAPDKPRNSTGTPLPHSHTCEQYSAAPVSRGSSGALRAKKSGHRGAPPPPPFFSFFFLCHKTFCTVQKEKVLRKKRQTGKRSLTACAR